MSLINDNMSNFNDSAPRAAEEELTSGINPGTERLSG